MKSLQAGGKINKGELVIFNEEVFYQQIQEIGFVNYVKITLEYGNKRTLDQNAYAFALFTAMALRMRQDGWDVDKDMIYRKVEQQYCTETRRHPETGNEIEFTTPLKKKDTDEFAEILDAVRMNFMQQYPDTHLKTPAEYYGMSEYNYNRWKAGEITRTEAIKED